MPPMQQMQSRFRNRFKIKKKREVFEFTTNECSVVEWMEKVQMMCDLCWIKQVERVLPLTGGAYTVYLQLSQEDKTGVTRIKKALCAASATDTFTAYEQFASRTLRPGETLDAFLAELRKLMISHLRHGRSLLSMHLSSGASTFLQPSQRKSLVYTATMQSGH